MSRWVVPAVVVVCALTGCSGGDEIGVKGTLVLTDGTQVGYQAKGAKGQKCWGSGKYRDLEQGAKVVVRDPDGEEVAEGTLAAGRLLDDSESFFAGPCRFRFDVPGLPSDADGSWTVQVAKLKPVKFTPGEDVGIEFG